MKRISKKQVYTYARACSFQHRLLARPEKTNIYILFLISLLSMTTALTFGQNLKGDSTNNTIILFVCEHGAARSTIAAAYFNKLAKERGLNYKAIFRGINPDTTLSKDAKKGLIEDGFNVSGWRPELVGKNDINTAAEIITLDCKLNANDSLSKPVYYWSGVPPISQDYQAARNYILQKIRLLIEELEQGKADIKIRQKTN